jgi:PRC-barrel domain
MTLPSVEAARNWSGLTAVDSDDQPLGRITDVYLDGDTGLPEWALVATPQRRGTFVPLAGAARTGDRVTMAVQKGAVSDAPTVRPRRELSDGDAARLYGHYLGRSGDRTRGARRARGRGPVARLRAATAPPARSAAARLREARGRAPEAGRSGRALRRSLVGLGSALVVVGVLARRVRRRRAPSVGEALDRMLAELLAGFRAALPRRRGRRWLGSLGGPRRGGGRRSRGTGADPIAASSGLAGSWW